MPIVRVTKKQIEAANKAREAALKKDGDFRRHAEAQRQQIEAANKAREAALRKEIEAAMSRKEEQPS
jgi:hypothetical protein